MEEKQSLGDKRSEDKNSLLHPLLQDMVDAALKPYMTEEELMKDSMFKAAAENMLTIASNHFVKDPDMDFCIVELGNNVACGCVYILGEPFGLDAGEQYKLLEQRILGMHEFYLFIIIGPKDYDLSKNIIPINIKDINVSKITLRVDALSRILDYMIDCRYDDQSKSTALHTRDGQVTNDPVVCIAKAVLLYHDLMCNTPMKKYIESLEKEDNDNDQQDLLWFNLIDAVMINNIRTDWLPLSTFKSNDKLQVFQPQISLREEIYNLAKDMYHDCVGTFYLNYKEMFTGDIYVLAGYEMINTFLLIGLNPFSTEHLTEVWRQYC